MRAYLASGSNAPVNGEVTKPCPSHLAHEWRCPDISRATSGYGRGSSERHISEAVEERTHECASITSTQRAQYTKAQVGGPRTARQVQPESERPLPYPLVAQTEATPSEYQLPKTQRPARRRAFMFGWGTRIRT